MNWTVSGPATWASKFPQAAGSRQSPVDINTAQVSSGVEAQPLTATYEGVRALRLVNPGYGWKVDVNGEGSGEEKSKKSAKYQQGS